MSWTRQEHQARTVRTTPAVNFDVIDVTPPEQLINRRVTREQLELHHARRNQVIELAALKAATQALEPRESIVDRASRYLRELLEGRR